MSNLIYKIRSSATYNDIASELKLLFKSYYFNPFQFHFRFVVIYMMDGRFCNNGLADRLRGMVSSYAFAKAIGRDFKIDHKVPFELATYLEPNTVKWLCGQEEISYNLLQSQPVAILDYSKGNRVKWLHRYRQYHFHSNVNFINVVNAAYGTDFKYHRLFQELFKPSKLLIDSLQDFQKYIDQGYISISFRFMQLMGDFVDERGNTLSEVEQGVLADKCIKFIEQIHDREKCVSYILVTSDSSKFMKRISELSYVFYIPGDTGHIAYKNDDGVFLKTFQDFYMISQARKAYLGYTGDMYKSNFAKEAALSTNIPFEAIEF